VRPLEALRETGEAARVMTVGRWVAGLLFFGGALTLVLVAPHGGPAGGPAVAMNVPMLAAVAVAAFSPLLVPLLGRLLPTGAGVTGTLARANLWDARRRSASVAAPLIALVALVVGTAGVGMSITDASVAELRRQIRADLVVEATGPVGAAIARVPGVAAVSSETSLPARVTVGAGEEQETDTATVLVVDPEAYAAVHSTGDALAALRGRVAAAGPAGDVPVHGSVRVELPDTDLGAVPIVAAVPVTMSGDANLLVPPGLVPAGLLAHAPNRSFVTLRPGADPAATGATLSRIGAVSTLDEWLRADAKVRSSTNDKIMLVVMGLGGLYALIGVVNSVVIAAAARRREFAEARVAGLTRGQVIRSALLESWAVTLAGLLLGGVAAGAALIAAMSTTKAVTGVATVSLPWSLIAGVSVLALLVTSATSVITSSSATRHRPVTLLAARE
jgi:putative ABC transport system permease protein